MTFRDDHPITHHAKLLFFSERFSQLESEAHALY
jgi:hypothetical protein